MERISGASDRSSRVPVARLLGILLILVPIFPSQAASQKIQGENASVANSAGPPSTAPSAAEPTARFVPPPRSIADITTVLEGEKPDLQKIATRKAIANAEPAKDSGEELAKFYFSRSNARAQLGRLDEAIADSNKAVEVGNKIVSANLMGRLQQFLAQLYSASGDLKKGLEINQRQLASSNVGGAKGFAFGANLKIAQILVQMGDVAGAEASIRRSDALIDEARTSPEPGWRTAYATKGEDWESMVQNGHAVIFEARGQFSEAEQAYEETERRKKASMEQVLKLDNPPSESLLRQIVDYAVLNQGRMKARQGRLTEAEIDARRALLSQLKDVGKYNPVTIQFIRGFSSILLDEGRYADAEKLTRIALDINRTVGVVDDALSNVQLLSQLGDILTLQNKYSDASAVYVSLDNAIASWEPRRRETFELTAPRISSLYQSKQTERGIAAAETLVKRATERVGSQHADTASAQALLAEGLMQVGRDADAARAFRTAIPILLARSHDNASDDDATVTATRSLQLQNTVEAYLTLLARNNALSRDAGRETFALADEVRGHSVQQALAASSARSAVKDPTLMKLVRKDQDLTKQLDAQLGSLNNLLSLPSSDRDAKVVAAIDASISALRTQIAQARHEIDSSFPTYADLVSPKPPDAEEIQATLATGEAMLSFYFGRSASFVWAVPKNGPVAFSMIKIGRSDVDAKVQQLRAALEPQAAMISDIPPFDLKLGYELYETLLKPVESGWKAAGSLIVVTNGALGLLPLSLLPTEPATAQDDDDVLFSGYRKIAWLARTHAVTNVPSAAALRSLRQSPAGRSGRGALLAFGDPIFDPSAVIEMADASSNGTNNLTRGVPLKRRNVPKLDGVDSADLAMLPRLPDTADELRSIALALNVDPSKVLYLGKEANETAVKTMDLSRYKIVAFATHGLVPGELDGLTQPALALSSPMVTGEAGDGLLTMEEILALKLDADWVVLSACNTGAGAVAGAEAASGLGRAFFYAGTRALLVTNWSVHSQSARELITDLFRRQAADASLARGDALRQAMMALVDGRGNVDESGKTQFAYAHPLFWAPYSIIGDGGAR